jgi:dTDP-4-amino-4,6-dideoxygalactose transaminase
LKPVPFISLDHQHTAIRTSVLEALTNVYDKNWFILGKELESFENEYAQFSNSAHCIGVGNGLDALFIGLKACGVGAADEVIVPSHTFLATWLAVTRTGATIVPVEPDPITFNLDTERLHAAITAKTKAIIPVHLYGQACDMSFTEEAHRRQIFVVEDNAQAHGATWNGKITGSVGDISATSFYPIKNLGAAGDGGAIVTNNDKLAAYARRYRNYGFTKKNVADLQGVNSRLDEIQAAILRIKLRHLKEWNADRYRLAQIYHQQLSSVGAIQLPGSTLNSTHVFHLFVIKTSKRNELRNYLLSRQIETSIHYPLPPHLQESCKNLGFRKGEFPVAEEIAETSLSLPLWPGMEPTTVEYVCDTIKNFFDN